MARLPILEYPDPRLRIRAEPVTKVDAEIRRIAKDMLETMYAAPGIGLAATQVDIHKRLIVLDISEDRNQPYCLINPEIVAREGAINTEEGCLSVPGTFDCVDRARKIKVRALDTEGAPFDLEAEDALAVCIQHEMDHLDGKLFVDYLSEMKRQRLKKKMLKKGRHGAEDSAGQSARVRQL